MDNCSDDCNTCDFAGGCKDYGKNIHFSLDNFSMNEENIWMGNTIFKFYHHQRCPNCNYSVPGWNDLNSEGPWDFECRKCYHKWSIAMLSSAKIERRKLLSLLKSIDRQVTKARQIRRRYITR